MTDDPVCNDNGIRLKRFVRETGYCMTQTYFNHPEEERYTWFSSDKMTKKVLDYVIAENFIQQYVNDCEVDTKFECDSDHRILITTLQTPTTKKARWKPKSPKPIGKIDIKALRANAELRTSFLNTVKEEMQTPFMQSGSNLPEQMNANIITLLKKAAESTLPKLSKKRVKEVWKDDKVLNDLLKQREIVLPNCEQHISLTKEIKKRVSQLRNEKVAKEVEELNDYANKKQIENLFRSFKSDNSSFKSPILKRGCEPAAMKTYFQHHFTSDSIDRAPIELIDAPGFLQALKDISTHDLKVGPPDESEICSVIKKLKDGKSTNDVPSSFIKNALGCLEFKNELVRLYATILNH